MVSLSLCVLSCLLAVVVSKKSVVPGHRAGNLCGDLEGYWVNKLNSEMHIVVGCNGEISGQYYTAVKTSPDAAGHGKARLDGRIVGSVVTFNAAWKGGESMTTWIGQCYHHNKAGKPQPALLTTWVYHSVADDISDNWKTKRKIQYACTYVHFNHLKLWNGFWHNHGHQMQFNFKRVFNDAGYAAKRTLRKPEKVEIRPCIQYTILKAIPKVSSP